MGKSIQDAPEKQKVKKTKSHRKLSASEDAGAIAPPATAIQPDVTVEKPEGVENELSLEDRRARKKALKAARRNGQTPSQPTTETTKGKKRKVDAEEAEEENDSPAEKPLKKRRKNRTEFADPRVDEELNEHSRRALEYAFLQMNKPEKWKFNKARQNWLIRNVWNPEAISDTYFPLVVKYLSLVQGGTRERLTQSCQSYLKEEEKAEKEDEKKTEPSTQPADTTTPPKPRSILKPTPGPLIDVSSTESTAAPAAVVPPPAPKPSLTDIRRTRAQSLLDALHTTKSDS